MNKAENEAYVALIFKAIKYVILRDDSYGSINLVLTYPKKYLIINLREIITGIPLNVAGIKRITTLFTYITRIS